MKLMMVYVSILHNTNTTPVCQSITVGDCNTDSLTVTNPGGSVPPTICGYNTGQHMYVPASSQVMQLLTIRDKYSGLY